MAEVSQAWLDRVQRAQQMAAERLGVDVSVMLPPRTGGHEGGEAEDAPAVEASAATVVETAAEAVAEPVAEATPEPVAATGTAATAEEAAAGGEDAAAQRVAEAKARAAARSAQTNGGGAAAAAPPPKDRVAPVSRAAVLDSIETGQEGINRREFLTYAWAGALGLLTLETGLATYQFMYPRFRAGEFGGKFILGPAANLPPMDVGPQGETTGKFWLVNTDVGPKALYMVCTHLGCLYKWEPSNNRFECPCHGSKFSREGDYIEGPAPRSLDQFVIEVVDGGATVDKTEDVGDSIAPPDVPGPTAEIVVDTGKRIMGKPAATSPARATA